MSEDIKEFESINITEPIKKSKDKIESKPKRKYKKKEKDKSIEFKETKEVPEIKLSEKRKEFLKTLERLFSNNEFVRYKEKIFKIKTFKCNVEGDGQIELFNKKFSCTVGLLVENLIEKDFEFDL